MFPNDPMPRDILQGGNKVELCKWFSIATEVRKKDGSPYPPRTIHHYLLAFRGILREAVDQHNERQGVYRTAKRPDDFGDVDFNDFFDF